MPKRHCCIITNAVKQLIMITPKYFFVCVYIFILYKKFSRGKNEEAKTSKNRFIVIKVKLLQLV